MCGHEAPSICWRISQPSVIAMTHTKGLISLTFNETVILDTTFNQSEIGMKVSGPFGPYDVSVTLLNETLLKTPTPNMTIWFEYSIKDQIVGNGSEVLTLFFSTPNKIENSAYGFGSLNSSFTFSPYPQESSKTCGELVFAIPIYFMMIGIIAIGVISSIANNGMTIAWQALTVIQFVNFIPMMMIFSPSCLAQFGEYFNVFNANIYQLLKPATRGKIIRDDFHMEIEYKYIRAGYVTSSILYNALDLIVIWAVVLTLILIMFLGRRYC